MIFEESVVLTRPFEEVVSRVRDALASQGFGVLTEIDVQATLREKLGKTMGRYLILGACNPPLASRALDLEPQVGVLLPCNVVVREAEDGVVVEAMDPGVIATLVGQPELEPIADEARRLIGEALTRLSTSA
ncbi:MAG: DUF302 domain-containing protein [Actinomycetota bacterium]|jgi:uncharacterized protein (DUF302 family)|nr:DUF302 domain-containing protein [Actinomycetota bacterium]